jgi:hypothetical protein
MIPRSLEAEEAIVAARTAADRGARKRAVRLVTCRFSAAAAWRCPDCTRAAHRCFVCRRYALPADLLKCVVPSCGRAYHAAAAAAADGAPSGLATALGPSAPAIAPGVRSSVPMHSSSLSLLRSSTPPKTAKTLKC